MIYTLYNILTHNATQPSSLPPFLIYIRYTNKKNCSALGFESTTTTEPFTTPSKSESVCFAAAKSTPTIVEEEFESESTIIIQELELELKNLEAERKKKPNDHASLTLQIIRVNEELMEQHPPKSNKRECIRKKIRRVGFVTNKFQDEWVEWYKNRKTPEQNKKALVRRPNNRPPVSRMEVLLANNNDANAQILAKIIPDIEALKIGAAAAAPSTDVNAQMATNAAPSPSTDVASPATTTVSAAATSSTATIMKSDSCDIADDDDDELTAQPPTDVDAQMATKLAKALADIEAWSKIIS